ncbi:MAG: hypothetical protein ACHQXJ_02465, partial [Nitrososphaerales archaeon]
MFPIKNANAVQDVIELSQKTYGWTDVVGIAIVAPEYNLNSNQRDTIGDNGHGSIQACTKEDCIPISLLETASDSGIFTGAITLASDTGITSHCDPVCDSTSGKLRAESSDQITVTFVGSDGQQIAAYGQIISSGQSSNVQQSSASINGSSSSSNTGPSLFDAKDSGCKEQFGSNFYYDTSQDKCMPPTGTWEYAGTDYLNQQCQEQYGSSYTYNGGQNRCLPSSGTPTNDDISKQCQDQFWSGFYYDSTQNACLPPGGSWQTYTTPQTGMTDSQGELTFQIAGQSVPFKFVDGDTNSPLSGLDVSFALDSKTQSVGVLLILDPTNQYPFQLVTLIDDP